MEILRDWLWQGATVAILAAALLRSLRRAHARHRYLVCAAAWMTVLLLPVLEIVAPTISVPATLLVPAAAGVLSDAGAANGWNWSAALVLLWVAWMTIGAAAAIRALIGLRRISTSAVPISATTHSAFINWTRVSRNGRQARLVRTPAVPSAGVLVGRPPLIALSPSLVEILDNDQVDHVILHEWAHVQRRDDLVNLALIAGRVVAGWHPAMWWLTRRLELEREIACDEMVVDATGGRKRYASCLAHLASRLGPHRSTVAIPGMLSGSVIARRIVHLLKLQRPMAASTSGLISAMAVAAVSTVTYGMVALEIDQGPVAIVEETLPEPPSTVQPVSTPMTGSPSFKLRAIQRPAATRARTAASTPSPVLTSVDQPTGSDLVTDAPPAPNVDSIATAPPSDPAPAADATAPTSPGASTGKEASPAPPPAREISPWQSAADGGVAIGRESQKAAVATAGFFTRFAKKVAGSFKY